MADEIPAVDSAPTLWEQFHRMLGWLRLFSYSAIGLFFFFLIFEAMRVYRSAADVHPWFGYLSLVGMGLALSLVAYPGYRFLRLPGVVQPPNIPVGQDVRPSHLKAEVRYLDRYLASCARNNELSEKQPDIQRCRDELTQLSKRIRAADESRTKPLDAELIEWTGRNMNPLLADLDQRADRVIYQESLAVGLATAASPNGTLDAFVMLWRSVNMVSKLGCLYYGRPGLWGTLAICRDVSVATALAGYMQNVTDSLGGLLAKSVGGVTGVVAGPAVDGVTNALVMIRIGHLAKQRCRSFRQWDAQARRSAVVLAIATTQRVAVGLTAEIVRQMGAGLGAVAGRAVGGINSAAGAVRSAAGSVADGIRNAATAASGWKQAVTDFRDEKQGTQTDQNAAKQ